MLSTKLLPRSRRWVAFLVVLLGLGITIMVSDTVQFWLYSKTDFWLYGTSTSKDEADAEAVRNIILMAHSFTRNSVSQPRYPPVFFSSRGSKFLLKKPIAIKIYDVESSAEQDKIINAVQGVVTARQSNPVDLSFYEHENWVVDGNVALRGPEKLLRQVRLR